MAECLDLSNPDISEACRVPVILQANRILFGMGSIFRGPVERRVTLQLKVVEDQNAVVQHGDERWAFEFAVFEPGCLPDHVIGLPFTGLPRSIHHWRRLFIDGATLAIEIGFILIGIKNLDFISIHQEYTAIATTLAAPLNFLGGGKLNMQLAIAEFGFTFRGTGTD